MHIKPYLGEEIGRGKLGHGKSNRVLLYDHSKIFISIILLIVRFIDEFQCSDSFIRIISKLYAADNLLTLYLNLNKFKL